MVSHARPMSGFSRWLPTASMMLVTVLSYVDRNTLALLAPSILADTKLSAAQYGWVVSAYSFAFMVSNPLWGRALDRIGLRLGMTAAVALWTLASASHALAFSFLGFVLARAALGLGEGAAAPGGLRTVTQTLPTSSRSRGIALSYSGGSAGAIITPLLMAPVAALWGWRGAFVFTGLLGAAWIAGWLVLSGREDIRRPLSTSTESAGDRPRFSDRRLIGFLLAYALGALPLGFTVYSSALYMSRALGISQATLGMWLWVPPLGSELGIFFWGALADRMSRGSDRIAAIKRLLPLAVVLSLPLALLPLGNSFPVALGQFFFAMFVASAFQLLVISYGVEVFSRAHAGYVAGLGSGAYGAGLAIAMPLIGSLFDLKQYAAAFAFAAACPMLGYAAFMLLTKPIQPTHARAF
jgi:ACS family hexuronate transporter-like MFS transporter